jgi:hypothetical protein
VQLFFSCCDSVAALPASANCNGRRGVAGNGPGNSIKFLRRTTSGAAGPGLRTTIKYLRGAAGIGHGTTIKYLRRSTSGAAGSSLGTTLNYLRGAAG